MRLGLASRKRIAPVAARAVDELVVALGKMVLEVRAFEFELAAFRRAGNEFVSALGDAISNRGEEW